MSTNSTIRFIYKHALPLVIGGLLLVVAGCAAKQSTAPVQPATSRQGGSQPATGGEAAQPNAEAVNKQPNLGKMEKADLNPQIQITQQGATLNWVDGNGKTKMSASLREVRGDLVSNVVAAYDFSGKLYEGGRQTASLIAPKVVVDSDNQVVTATGGVTLKSAQRNSVVRSSWMKYYAKQHRVIGNGGVKITSDMGTYEGAYFEADTDLRTFTLDSSAKGHKY